MTPFRRFLSIPRRYPVRTLLAVAAVAAASYFLWDRLPATRFRREYARAEQSLAECDFAAARGHFAECLRIRPDDAMARLAAARAARRDGDLAAADDLLDRYRDLVGDGTEAERLERSMLHAQRGELEQELPFLTDCLDIRHPAAELILEALAMGSVQVYQLDKATFWIHELLQRNPTSPVGRLLRAQVGQSLNMREKSLESLRELVAEYPRYAKARLTLADLLARAHLHEEALPHYQALHAASPRDLGPLLGAERCLIRLGRTEEARPLVRELEEQHADNSEALLDRGRFAIQDGRDADAARFLRRAVELAPFDHEVHLQLGTCLARLGRADEAAVHVARSREIEADLHALAKAVEAIVKTPDDPAPRLEAGRICLRNGQDQEGLRWLLGTLERHPGHKPTHQALADYFAAHDNPRKAAYHRRLAR